MNGQLYCWGFNGFGQCDVPAVDAAWSSVAVGVHHSCGVTVDGRAHCWGRNNDGQLDIPDLHTAEAFEGVWAAQNMVCGVTSLHRGVCWGRNSELPDSMQRMQWLALRPSLGIPTSAVTLLLWHHTTACRGVLALGLKCYHGRLFSGMEHNEAAFPRRFHLRCSGLRQGSLPVSFRRVRS